MTDHGPVHVKIVMNIASKLLRVLVEAGVEPGVVRNYGMAVEDAEVVVVLASLLHDVGMSVHRKDHEEFSLFVAQPMLKELLEAVYDVGTATILRSEVLHAIIGHRSGGQPLTLEAGIVRVADALDMAKGRSRIAMGFEGETMSIHSISAAAIEAVHIEAGEEKPGAHPRGDVQLGRHLPARPALPREAARERPGAVRRGGGADRERGGEAAHHDGVQVVAWFTATAYGNGRRQVGRVPPLRSGPGFARRRERYYCSQRRRASLRGRGTVLLFPAAPASRPCGRESLTQLPTAPVAALLPS
jgi:hypothetical protein